MRSQSEEKTIEPAALVRQFINALNIDLYFGQILDWVEIDYGYYASLCDSQAECYNVDDAFAAKMVRTLTEATSTAESYADSKLQRIAPELERRIAETIDALRRTSDSTIRTRLLNDCVNEVRKAVKPVLDECLGIFLESSEPSKVFEKVYSSVSTPIPSAIEQSLLDQYKQLCELRWLAAGSLERMLCNENFDKALTLLAAAIRNSVE